MVSFSVKETSSLPESFVYVKTIIPDLDVELRYYSSNNFVGDTITGYKSNTLILTRQAAEALKNVQGKIWSQKFIYKRVCFR